MRFVLPHPVAAIVFSLALLISSAVKAQEVAPAEAEAVQGVITDQLNAFKAREHDRAYSHAAPNVKRIFPNVDRFIGMVSQGYGAIYTSDGYLFGRNLSLNGDIYQEVLITDQSGKQWQAVYTLRQQEDGSWKITGVKMNPYAGAQT